jgi:ketosteroid isomerase-like protein
MLQEKPMSARAARIALAGAETRRHRTLDERIIVRFPALTHRLLAAWAKLPRDSRLRRVLLVRAIRQGYAALNRRDFGFVRTGLDPATDLHRAQVFLDVSGTFHGHAGYLEVWRRAFESFADLRFDPEELLDFGDRILVTRNMSGHGAGSGVAITQKLYQLLTLRRGLVVRQDDFQARAEALEAVGLSE